MKYFDRPVFTIMICTLPGQIAGHWYNHVFVERSAL
jgi:hypothetical protein